MQQILTICHAHHLVSLRSHPCCCLFDINHWAPTLCARVRVDTLLSCQLQPYVFYHAKTAVSTLFSRFTP